MNTRAGVRASDVASKSREDEVLDVAVEDEEPAPWEEDDEKPVAGSHGQAEAEEAENLIGVDEAADNDPLKHYVVMQNQICYLQEDQSRIERQEAKARSAQGDQRVAAEMQVLAA